METENVNYIIEIKLQNNTIYIEEDDPEEVIEKRKYLKPKLIAAKKEGKQACIKYDKLIIEENMKKRTFGAANDSVEEQEIDSDMEENDKEANTSEKKE